MESQVKAGGTAALLRAGRISCAYSASGGLAWSRRDGRASSAEGMA